MFHAHNQPNGFSLNFSVRKIVSTYSGSCMRVRKDSTGNPEQNIGFTGSGDLDTSALKSFAGANSCYVVTWYDQGINGLNATQTTTAAQPKIVSAGIINRQNGWPCIDFGTTTDDWYLSFTTNILQDMLLDIFTVMRVDNYDSFGTIFFGCSTQNPTFWQLTTGGANYVQGNGPVTSITVNDGVARLVNNFSTSTVLSVRYNTVQYTASLAPITIAVNSRTYTIGSYDAGSLWSLDGAISEFRIYSTIQTSLRSTIESNINSYFTIY